MVNVKLFKNLYIRFAALLVLFFVVSCVVAALYSPVENWSLEFTFQKRFILVVSLFTTVGWGHVSPTTKTGQIFTVFFGFIGIPITFIFLLTGGQIFNKLFLKLTKLVTCHKAGKDLTVKIWNLLITSTVILPIYLLFVSAITTAIEDIDFAKAFYYAFITLSTTGFGDLVPGKMLEGSKGARAFHTIVFLVWYLLGLMLVASFFISVVDLLKAMDENDRNGQKSDEINLVGTSTGEDADNTA